MKISFNLFLIILTVKLLLIKTKEKNSNGRKLNRYNFKEVEHFRLYPNKTLQIYFIKLFKFVIKFYFQSSSLVLLGIPSENLW